MSKTHVLALKIAAGLWVVWGLVHALAGVIVLSSDTSGALAAVADAVDPALLAADYHPAAGGIVNQHGWNLLWFGVVTLIGGILIWRANMTSIWVTGMVGGFADLGYFMFLDLPGHVHFLPGTLMTLVSGSAIILSVWVWLAARRRLNA